MRNIYIFVEKNMNTKSLLFALLLFPLFLAAQINTEMPDVDKHIRTDYVKSTMGIVQVLDSTIEYTFDGTEWDSIEKKCIVSRHWGTQGLPNEWSIFTYNTVENRWDYKFYLHYTYFSDTAEVVKEHLEKPFNSNTLSLEQDSFRYYKYIDYNSQQFGQMLSNLIYMDYDFNTCNYTGGMKYCFSMYNDTLYDEYVYKMLNPSTGIWENYASISFSYDQNNYLQKQLIRIWSSSENAYVNFEQNYFAFQNGRMIQKVYQAWNGSSWVNIDKYINTYSASGLISTEIRQEWDLIAMDWINATLRTHTYSAGLETENLYQTWDDMLQSWQNMNRNTFTYDVNSNMLTKNYETYDGVQWNNVDRYIWTYNGNNQVTLEKYDLWDVSLSVWNDGSKDIFTYDGNFNLTQELVQIWDGAAWNNVEKYEYTFDVNNNKTQYLFSAWNDVSLSWDWINKTEYYYSEFDATTINDIMNRSISVFPNPTNGYISIRPSDKVFKWIQITDAAGRVVIDKHMSETTSIIDLKQYGSGLYNICLFDDGGNAVSSKVIVQ